MISEVDEPSIIKGKSLRVSIFMNVFNVHVNRYPVTGTVFATHYNPGKFPQRLQRQGEPRQRTSTRHQIPSTGFSSARSPGLIAATHRDVQQSRRCGTPGRSLRHHSLWFAWSTSSCRFGSTVKVKLGQLNQRWRHRRWGIAK